MHSLIDARAERIFVNLIIFAGIEDFLYVHFGTKLDSLKLAIDL